MPAYIQNIATAVPEPFYEQDFLREQMKGHISHNDVSERIIHRIYAKSGIEKRHTVIRDFVDEESPPLFFNGNGSLQTPSTGIRNERYTEEAKPLFVKTAQKTIRQNEHIDKDDITHIITVSCTGFFAPEPGFEIIKQLELSTSVQRFHIGFMGCFAAFPAMKMARSFCEANPDARVLVVCLELCTLHLQDSQQTDQLISASVFADGAAGMLVTPNPPEDSAGFKIKQFANAVADDSEEEMSWTIGDTGFDMVLSSYVPQIIESNLEQVLQPVLKKHQLCTDDIKHWAIHPGGRAILDKIEQSFSLDDVQLAASRRVLASYGNMSSATILFVLADMLSNKDITAAEPILAMAFGPGLTIESGLLTKVQPA